MKNEKKRPFILLTLLVFQFEILGKYFNNEQWDNRLFVFQFEISGKDFNNELSENR